MTGHFTEGQVAHLRTLPYARLTAMARQFPVGSAARTDIIEIANAQRKLQEDQRAAKDLAAIGQLDLPLKSLKPTK